MTPENLLAPPPIHLPPDGPDATARTALADGVPLRDVVPLAPASCLLWALLAEDALAADDGVGAYAFARTGYHRGLDALRRAGWRGAGAIPVSSVPNQGFLRSLLALAEAAAAIGEHDEAQRCQQFLADSGTTATEVAALRSA